MLRPRARSVLTAAALAFPAAGAAQTPLDSVAASPDVTVLLAGAPVADHQVVIDDLQGAATTIDLAPLPAAAAVDGLHVTGDGSILFSLATATELDGVTYRAADVVEFGGGSYSLAFDGAAAGVPAGADLDALTLGGGGELLVSFDVAVDLPGGPFADEDLVAWDGSGFSLVLDGSEAGVPAALDLDAAHRLAGGHLLLSFDGAGVVGGIAFADEDLLEYEPAAALWSLAYDGSSSLPGWEAADLDAVTVGVLPSILEIPTLDAAGLVLLAALLAGGGFLLLGRSYRTRHPGIGTRP